MGRHQKEGTNEPSSPAAEGKGTEMSMHDYEIVKAAATNKLNELRADYDKLKAVDKLIGEDATDQKKRELLAAIMAVQEVQSSVLDVFMRDVMPNEKVNSASRAAAKSGD